DAGGATHDIAITVTGAHSEPAAEAVGRAVARSNLVKTAIFGNDPNWGRILSQVGTVPTEVAHFAVDEVDVTINGVMICHGGMAHRPRTEVDLAANREVDITINLNAGDAQATIWTNDLTHAYVHENSAYST
ncbi:MAG TPA: bifunctional ornithine acetyltransferase/N-acetylglutamate synthase, partial [Beutenbergiaceae bacterium]|nr:bifunctional ornithine acetyltransferase/N-acetylglutamate synthase [Beutenbergiaceae bacterium]